MGSPRAGEVRRSQVLAIEDGHLHSPGVRDSREKSVAVARGRNDEFGARADTVDTASGN